MAAPPSRPIVLIVSDDLRRAAAVKCCRQHCDWSGFRGSEFAVEIGGLSESEKGKPGESRGRKITGLRGLGPMTAGLPDTERALGVFRERVASRAVTPHVESGPVGHPRATRRSRSILFIATPRDVCRMGVSKNFSCVRSFPRALAKLAVAAAVLSSAAPAVASDPADPPRQLASVSTHIGAERSPRIDVNPYVREMASLINRYRADRGLAPLELVPELTVLAEEHSSQMAEERVLSHSGFRNRFDRTRARLCVENVGVNFPHAEAQLDGWRASPGHHRNLLEPKVARMGIATSQRFVTYFACS